LWKAGKIKPVFHSPWQRGFTPAAMASCYPPRHNDPNDKSPSTTSMKKPLQYLLLTSLCLMGSLFLIQAQVRADARHERGATAPAENAEPWTCTMHRQVQQPQAGSCPICDMDLIPLSEAKKTDSIDGDALHEEDDPEKTLAYRGIKYSGKFHPLAVHFPIAFLLAAATMQWFFIRTRRSYIPPIVSTMLWFGTLGAIGAAAFGWAYAYDSVYFGEDEKLLFLHRWLGTATAIAATLLLALRRLLKPLHVAILLTVLAALVGAAAHFGASLLYGIDHFTEF